MSTRSFIARQTETGYEGVYCHWDGYPDYNGAVLQSHYTDPHKIAYLLSFGDISSLGPEIGEKDHDFEDRGDGLVTTFYGRDRGERGEHTYPCQFACKCDLQERAASIGCEFVYIFENESWSFCERRPQFFGCDDGTEFSEFKPLEEVVTQKT